MGKRDQSRHRERYTRQDRTTKNESRERERERERERRKRETEHYMITARDHTWSLHRSTSTLEQLVLIVWHRHCTSRGLQNHRQKHDLECPSSAGDTRFYIYHTQPFCHPSQASGRSSEDLLSESSVLR